MVVQPALREIGVVFRGEQHLVCHELDVMQHAFAADLLLVVPVDHARLVRRVDRVVVQILRDVHFRRRQPPRKLRIHADERLVVDQLDVKQMPRALDVRDPRLPKQIQRIDLADRDVPETV